MNIILTKSDLINRVLYVDGKKEQNEKGLNIDFFDAIAKYNNNIKVIEIKQKSITIKTK